MFNTVFVKHIHGGTGQFGITALLLHRKALDEEQQRVAFYPGSDTKFQRFKKAFQGVEEHGAQPMQTDGFKTAPWLLKTGLTPQEVSHRKIGMHALAQDGCCSQHPCPPCLADWNNVPKELPFLADLSQCEQLRPAAAHL